MTPYAAVDKDLSNIESDEAELKKLEAFNAEQVGKILRVSTKEQGWEELVKSDGRQVKMLNYMLRRDYRLAKLLGLGLTDRQVPKVGEGEKLEYALFAVRKGQQADVVHRIVATPGEKPDWPTDFHFNVERRKFAKDSILRFSWMPELAKGSGVTGFMTFYRPKGSDDDYLPTSPRAHPMPNDGEYHAFHKWESETHEYDYALACVNAFGSYGPLMPEGTSTDKFTIEDGPPIAPGVRLGTRASRNFTIAGLREPDTKLRTRKHEQRANGIGEIVATYEIQDRDGKVFLTVSYEADHDKVDLKCSVKVYTQSEPLIPTGEMTTKIVQGKLIYTAELELGEDDKFVVMTGVATK